jgi:hypothetical protein
LQDLGDLNGFHLTRSDQLQSGPSAVYDRLTARLAALQQANNKLVDCQIAGEGPTVASLTDIIEVQGKVMQELIMLAGEQVAAFRTVKAFGKMVEAFGDTASDCVEKSTESVNIVNNLVDSWNQRGITVDRLVSVIKNNDVVRTAIGGVFQGPKAVPFTAGIQQSGSVGPTNEPSISSLASPKKRRTKNTQLLVSLCVEARSVTYLSSNSSLTCSLELGSLRGQTGYWYELGLHRNQAKDERGLLPGR